MFAGVKGRLWGWNAVAFDAGDWVWAEVEAFAVGAIENGVEILEIVVDGLLGGAFAEAFGFEQFDVAALELGNADDPGEVGEVFPCVERTGNGAGLAVGPGPAGPGVYEFGGGWVVEIAGGGVAEFVGGDEAGEDVALEGFVGGLGGVGVAGAEEAAFAGGGVVGEMDVDLVLGLGAVVGEVDHGSCRTGVIACGERKGGVAGRESGVPGRGFCGWGWAGHGVTSGQTRRRWQ